MPIVHESLLKRGREANLWTDVQLKSEEECVEGVYIRQLTILALQSSHMEKEKMKT